MSLEEEYLGGFASANLKRGLVAGYGIYATNKRIIGVKRKALGTMLAAPFGVVDYLIVRKLSKDESAKTIAELDEKKDFDIAKESLASIEVKKPGMLGTGGFLLLTPKNGEATKVMIYAKKEFGQLRDLMQAFSPEILKVDD